MQSFYFLSNSITFYRQFIFDYVICGQCCNIWKKYYDPFIFFLPLSLFRQFSKNFNILFWYCTIAFWPFDLWTVLQYLKKFTIIMATCCRVWPMFGNILEFLFQYLTMDEKRSHHLLGGQKCVYRDTDDVENAHLLEMIFFETHILSDRLKCYHSFCETVSRV